MCKYVEMRRLWKAGRIVFVLAALSPAMIKMRILAYITMSHNLAYITMSHNLAYITMSHNLAYITMSQSLAYITFSCLNCVKLVEILFLVEDQLPLVFDIVLPRDGYLKSNWTLK